MTDTPKDGDLGLTRHPLFVRYDGSEWMHPNGRDADVVTPTGERAIPIDVCERASADLRDAANEEWTNESVAAEMRADADVLDPPTPEQEKDA